MLTKRLRLSTSLLSLLFCVSLFAQNKNLEKDVTMVSYEQGWLDSYGTLALKNNTKDEIRNLQFQITYLDMSGNPLDYEDYVRDVTIAPGMTKKIDIPAYEHSRYYHYYKSDNKPGGSPSFKIKFQLKDYNLKKEELRNLSENNYLDRFDYRRLDENEDNDGFYVVLCLVGVLMFVGISVGLYVLVAIMAKKRNRNVAVWILLSLLATPILMIIILLFIGNDGNNDMAQYN
ncbi:MAG: hypothetical protein J1E38_06815 [Paramuribaculum sp.]|nr:hypothetical protein [Paramuribaculum sp.]